MAFLLGSLTSGLFEGAKDMASLGNEWESLKQRRMETKRQQDMIDAASAVSAAGAADKNTPASTTPPTPTEKTYEPPDLNSVPQPEFMRRKPAVIVKDDLAPPKLLADDNSSPREGQAFGRNMSGLPGSTYNPATAAIPTTVTPSPPMAPLQPPYNPAGLVAPRTTLQPTGLVPGALPGALDLSHPTAPPQYLPGHPNNPATAPIPPAPVPAGQGQALPTLASQQGGLGAQILAALNPVYRA